MQIAEREKSNLLSRSLSFAVYSNLWISLGAFLWTYSTFWLFSNSTSFLIPGFVGAATLFTYNFQRLVKLHTESRRISNRNQWIQEHKTGITVLTIIGGAGTFFLTFFLPSSAIWLLIPLGIISLGYALEFLPAGKNTLNLRSLPGLKIILISLTWSIASVMLPLIAEANGIETRHYIFTFERFLFVIAITIPFDIRDLRYDNTQMKTLPQLLGIKGSLWLSTILLILSSLLDFWLFTLGVFPLCAFFSLLVSYIAAIVLVTLTTNHRPEWYFTGLIDGLFAFQFITLGLSCQLF